MYYEQFDSLCNSKGVKPSEVSRATGITTATLTSWKQGKYTPKQDKLQKIADFFGVSLEYLMTGKETEIENKYGAEITHMLGKIRNDEILRNALLKYFALSERQKAHVIETINLLSEVNK